MQTRGLRPRAPGSRRKCTPADRRAFPRDVFINFRVTPRASWRTVLKRRGHRDTRSWPALVEPSWACVLVLLLAVFGAQAADSPAARVEGTDKRWRDGPVQYFLTADEYRRYGRLKSEQERRRFVEGFWARLDPDPSTAENEFREQFELRCGKAEEFEDPTSPGWKTDRGRVLILLGEPDSVRRDAGELRGRDREIWSYAQPAGGGGSGLEISFYRDASGRLVLDPVAASGDLRDDPIARARERDRLRQEILGAYPQLSGFEIERAVEVLMRARADLSLTGRRTTPADVPRPRIPSLDSPSGEPPVEKSPLKIAAYFFRTADVAVLSMLALEFQLPPPESVGGSAAAAAEPSFGFEARAWISPVEPANPGAAAVVREVGFQLLSEGAAGRSAAWFVGRTHLEPGEYVARYAIFDPVKKSVAFRTTRLEVPEMRTGSFTASSVVPAERFGALGDRVGSPFAVGSEEVVPRPGGTFHRGEPLRLYLQVYDAARDPAGGKPRMDVRFFFERAGRRGFRPYGKSFRYRGAEGASLGLALPIGDWPSGVYRVGVDLVDRVSGARTTAEGSFTLKD